VVLSRAGLNVVAARPASWRSRRSRSGETASQKQNSPTALSEVVRHQHRRSISVVPDHAYGVRIGILRQVDRRGVARFDVALAEETLDSFTV
jgi:hypothetical protein